MKKMGRYCKAYPINQLRQFPQWTEQHQNIRADVSEVDGQEVTVQRTLTEDDFLYLQENYVVTDDIFLEDHIIFDAVSPEWMAFCTDVLKFEVPTHEGSDVSTHDATLTTDQPEMSQEN